MSDTLEQLKPMTPSGPPPEAVDDSGSQALSEALSSSFAIIKLVMVLLVVAFLGSGFFTVRQDERAVILRFGKPVGDGEKALLGPGLHWGFPSPVDEVVRIPIGQVQTVNSSVGWYRTTAAQEASGQEPEPGESLRPGEDGYIVTGDENIIHARGTLRYRISEPGLRFMFDFAIASNLVQNAFNNALLYAAATYPVDDILTRDVAGFRERARLRLEQLVDDQKLGITVDQIDNVQVIPPRKLKAAFAAVLEADVKRGKLLNEARSYENQTVSQAKGEANVRTNAAIAARTRLVESVAAEAKRFTDLLPAYQNNPQLFLAMQQADVLQRVFTNAQDKVILNNRADGKPTELRLQLSREAQKFKAPEAPQQPAGDKH